MSKNKMAIPLSKKSTLQEIKERFDQDVDRFSNLETGQQAAVDSPLILDLISELSVQAVPHAQNLLDIGCGAGNNTIKILRKKEKLNCDLVDLSLPMLEKAKERLKNEKPGEIRLFQGDFQTIDLPTQHYDLIIAAAVLHHLRKAEDWLRSFKKIYSFLKPHGAFFVSDIFTHQDEKIHHLMWNRYGNYLSNQGGEKYKQKVFDYIHQEDSPRDLTYQLNLMKKVGFKKIDILHKNSCFGAYVGIKSNS